MQFRYFIANGRSLEQARAIQERAAAATKAAKEFADRHGAIQLYGYGSSIECADFPGTLPEGWRKGKGGRAYPLMKSKRGKEIAAEMAALPRRPTGMDLDEAFGCQPAMGEHGNGIALFHAGLRALAGQTVISIPVVGDGDVATPLDAEPLSEADFLRLQAADIEAQSTRTAAQ